MSLTQFLTTLRAAWLNIALMVVVAASVAFALASGLPKQYTAKARVMLNIDNDEPTQYSALGRGMSANYIGTELRLVADDAVARDVVTQLGWPTDPQVIGAWQAATGGLGDVTAWAASQIKPGIAAQPLEDSSIIEIFYASSSPAAAKQIVALVRNAYIDNSQRLRVEAARRAAAWNRTQATRALSDLRTAEAARATFVTTNQIPVDTPAGGLDYQVHMAAMIASTAALPGATQRGADDPNVDRLKRRLDGLDAELAVARLRSGEQNPRTLALLAARASITQQIAQEDTAHTATGGTAPAIGLVRQQRDADYLQARLRLLDRAPLYDRLAAMNRDIARKTQRYDAAASHIADFESVAAAPTGMRIIGDVIASDEPSYPNIPLMTALAAGTTLALAIGITLIAELRHRQVRGTEDLSRAVDAPILAVIADGRPRRRFGAVRAMLAGGAVWRRRRSGPLTSPGTA